MKNFILSFTKWIPVKIFSFLMGSAYISYHEHTSAINVVVQKKNKHLILTIVLFFAEVASWKRQHLNDNNNNDNKSHTNDDNKSRNNAHMNLFNWLSLRKYPMQFTKQTRATHTHNNNKCVAFSFRSCAEWKNRRIVFDFVVNEKQFYDFARWMKITKRHSVRWACIFQVLEFLVHGIFCSFLAIYADWRCSVKSKMQCIWWFRFWFPSFLGLRESNKMYFVSTVLPILP